MLQKEKVCFMKYIIFNNIIKTFEEINSFSYHKKKEKPLIVFSLTYDKTLNRMSKHSHTLWGASPGAYDIDGSRPKGKWEACYHQHAFASWVSALTQN